MGWELRKGRRYLYRVRKIDGRVVREYVGRDSQAGRFMGMMLFHMQDLAEEAREKERKASAEWRERVNDVVRKLDATNAELRLAAEAILTAFGFHKVNRGCWRMARTSEKTTATDTPATTPAGMPAGTGDAMVVYTAPDNNPAAADLFARSRAGDKAAQAELRRWLRETPGELAHYGDLSLRATHTLVGKITGGDPVWRIAVEEQVKAMKRELLGPTPTVLDELLVRRIANGWLCVHALEVELAVRTPGKLRDRAYLEAAVEKAAKRYERSIVELARVRRLSLPPILVNVSPPPPPLPPPPRVADADVQVLGAGASVGAEEKKSEAKTKQLPAGGVAKRGRGRGVRGEGKKAA